MTDDNYILEGGGMHDEIIRDAGNLAGKSKSAANRISN